MTKKIWPITRNVFVEKYSNNVFNNIFVSVISEKAKPFLCIYTSQGALSGQVLDCESSPGKLGEDFRVGVVFDEKTNCYIPVGKFQKVNIEEVMLSLVKGVKIKE